MRELLNGSPGQGEEEEENNRSPLSAEAPELSSHSSDEVPLLIFQAGLRILIRIRIRNPDPDPKGQKLPTKVKKN